jgi:DNA-binding MarR family transcriptional regulator
MASLAFLSLHEDLEIVLAHVIQDFMRAMKSRGLSTPQIHALMFIYHSGGCQVSDLGALTDVSNAAASQLVERLVQQRLVERREDTTDRRNKLVTLSEIGRTLFHESVMSNHYLMEIMAILTPKQRQVVHNTFILLAQTGRQIQNKTEKENRSIS